MLSRLANLAAAATYPNGMTETRQPLVPHDPPADALGAGIERTETLGGVNLLAVRHPPGHALPWHRHDAPALVLVRQGAYRQHGTRRPFECSAHELAVVPAEERHREEIGRSGSSALLVFFNDRRWHDDRVVRDLLDCPQCLRAPWIPHLGDALARELEENDDCSRLALEGLALEVLARAARQSRRRVRGRPPGWLERGRAMIDDNCGRPIALAGLAAEAGVSRAHFARSFRAFFGTTPGAYVRAARTEYAATLLRDTAEPLADVALEAGFCDQSHLTNTFRRFFGTTPQAYRDAHGRDGGRRNPPARPLAIR